VRYCLPVLALTLGNMLPAAHNSFLAAVVISESVAGITANWLYGLLTMLGRAMIKVFAYACAVALRADIHHSFLAPKRARWG
jgi:hypothetical protein